MRPYWPFLKLGGNVKVAMFDLRGVRYRDAQEAVPNLDFRGARLGLRPQTAVFLALGVVFLFGIACCCGSASGVMASYFLTPVHVQKYSPTPGALILLCMTLFAVAYRFRGTAFALAAIVLLSAAAIGIGTTASALGVDFSADAWRFGPAGDDYNGAQTVTNVVFGSIVAVLFGTTIQLGLSIGARTTHIVLQSVLAGAKAHPNRIKHMWFAIALTLAATSFVAAYCSSEGIAEALAGRGIATFYRDGFWNRFSAIVAAVVATTACASAPNPAPADRRQTDEIRSWVRARLVRLGTDFSRCNLAGARFDGVHVAHCDFRTAELSHATWSRCTGMSESTFAGPLSDAEGRRLLTTGGLPTRDLRDKDLSQQNLRQFKLAGYSLRRTRLGGADLRDADLTNVDFSNASLVAADLRGSDLTGANLTYTNFSSDTQLSGTRTRWVSMRGSRIPIDGKEEFSANDFEDLFRIPSNVFSMLVNDPDHLFDYLAALRSFRENSDDDINVTGVRNRKDKGFLIDIQTPDSYSESDIKGLYETIMNEVGRRLKGVSSTGKVKTHEHSQQSHRFAKLLATERPVVIEQASINVVGTYQSGDSFENVQGSSIVNRARTSGIKLGRPEEDELVAIPREPLE